MSSKHKTHYTSRLSVHITEAMSQRLDQIAIQRDEAKAEIVRSALRERDWFTSFLQLTQSMRQLTPEGSIFVSPDDRLIQVSAEFEDRAPRRVEAWLVGFDQGHGKPAA